MIQNICFSIPIEIAETLEQNSIAVIGHNNNINLNAVDDNARIAVLLNVLDKEDEQEIDELLNDNNFSSNEDDDDNDDWEPYDGLSELGLVEAVQFERANNLIFINGINCAAHTMQLVVRDALGHLPKHHKNVITLANKICKFFRKESTRNVVRNMGLKLKVPSVEMPTRWSSTYIMVRYFFVLSNFEQK